MLEKEIAHLFPIAKGIAETFGKNCEVAVHDLRKPETSLVYLVGNITRRPQGSPITNLVLEKLRMFGDECSDIIGYKNISKEGRILKSSTIFARDFKGQIIGCICINYDITDLLISKDCLEELVSFNNRIQPEEENEYFATDISDVLESMIDQVIKHMGVTVTQLQKEDKLQIVSKLDLKGAFLIKGAIDKVAAVLGVSRYTIYNYLDQERSKRNNNII